MGPGRQGREEGEEGGQGGGEAEREGSHTRRRKWEQPRAELSKKSSGGEQTRPVKHGSARTLPEGLNEDLEKLLWEGGGVEVEWG